MYFKTNEGYLKITHKMKPIIGLPEYSEGIEYNLEHDKITYITIQTSCLNEYIPLTSSEIPSNILNLLQ